MRRAAMRAVPFFRDPPGTTLHSFGFGRMLIDEGMRAARLDAGDALAAPAS